MGAIESKALPDDGPRHHSTRLPAQAVNPATTHVFISRASEQQYNLVDHVCARFKEKHPALEVFVDDWSLQAGDRAMQRISAECRGASVGVLILSKEFVRKRYCMAELHVLLQRWRAASDAAKQGGQEEAPAGQGQQVQLLPVLYNLTVGQLRGMRRLYDSEAWCVDGSKPSSAVLDQWAADLQEVAEFTMCRPDQSHGEAELVDWIVDRAVEAAGKLRKPAPASLEVRNLVTPPPPVALVGRQQELQRGLQVLLEQRFVEIRGAPGEGKSTLAQHLVAEVCSKWSQLPQEGAGEQVAYALEVDMRELKGTGNLQKAMAQKLLAMVHVAKKDAEWQVLLGELRRLPRVAIVLENADEGVLHEGQAFSRLLESLQPLQNVHLVVCTRAEAPVIPGVVLHSAVVLRPLTEDEGLQLVQAQLGAGHAWSVDDNDQETVRQLVRRVEGNPLVLTIATWLITAKDLSWQEVMDKAGSMVDDLNPRVRLRPGGLGSHMALLRKWLGSFLNEREQRFLADLAAFAGSFTSAGAAAVTGVHQPQADLLQLQFASLVRQHNHYHISSIQESQAEERYSMHALVREAAKGLAAGVPDSNSSTLRFVDWVLLQLDGPGQSLLRCEPDGSEPDMLQMWYLLREDLLNFSSAAAHIALVAALSPHGVPELVHAACHLGRVLSQCGHGPAGRQLHEAAAEISQRVLGPEHPDTLTSKHSLADALEAIGELGQAQQLLEEVLKARMHALGPEHPDTLTSKRNLAWVLKAMGEVGQARQLQEEVLESCTQVLGSEHPDTLTIKLNLAQTLRAMGQLGQARQLHEGVLEACTRVGGPEHPDTLTSKGNLALTLEDMGQLGQARQLQEEVLEARMRSFGPEHPDTLTSKHHLASTLQAMGELGQARQLQAEVLEARTRVQGPEHPDTLTSMGKLASISTAMGQLRQARQLQQETLEVCTRVLGSSHPGTLISKHNLASTLEVMGELGPAQQLQDEVLEAYTRVFGPEYPCTMFSSGNLALTLEAIGELGYARQLQQEGLNARARVLGPEHHHTLSIKRDLAWTLQAIRELAQARQL